MLLSALLNETCNKHMAEAQLKHVKKTHNKHNVQQTFLYYDH